MKAAKGIAIYPDKRVENLTVSTLKDYQSVVGGYIEAVDLTFGTMYVNEEFLYKCDPVTDRNSIATDLAGLGGRPDLLMGGILGGVLLLGHTDKDGESTDVTEAARKALKRVVKEAIVDILNGQTMGF